LGVLNTSEPTFWSDVTQPSYSVPRVTHLEVEGGGNDGTFYKRDAHITWRVSSLESGAGLDGPTSMGADEEPGGAAQDFSDSIIKDYKVTIKVDGVVRREEVVTQMFYDYTLEKNLQERTCRTTTVHLSLRFRWKWWQETSLTECTRFLV